MSKTLIELAGVVAVIGGVGMIFPPAALIVGGVVAILAIEVQS
jgi:hypothetical protein